MCWNDFFRNCHQVAVNLVTQNSIFCWLEPDSSPLSQRYWTISIFASSEQLNSTWQLANPELSIIIPPIVFYVVAFFLTVGLWIIFQLFVDAGWSFILIVATLQRFTPKNGNFTGQAISDWATILVNLRDDPNCLSRIRLIIFIVLLFVCVILLFIPLLQRRIMNHKQGPSVRLSTLFHFLFH
jgi:hypothetical protein